MAHTAGACVGFEAGTCGTNCRIIGSSLKWCSTPGMPASSHRRVGRMPDGRLRVVQLNAGSLLEPGWDDRRHEIVAWLERLEPDVVCLQEI